MINDLMAALDNERTEGLKHGEEASERLDVHIARLEAHVREIEAQIRDMTLLRAWMKDSTAVRAEAIAAIVGIRAPVQAVPVAVEKSDAVS